MQILQNFIQLLTSYKKNVKTDRFCEQKSHHLNGILEFSPFGHLPIFCVLFLIRKDLYLRMIQT